MSRLPLLALWCTAAPAMLGGQSARPAAGSPPVAIVAPDSETARTRAERDRARRDGVPVGWPVARRQFWLSGSVGRGAAGLSCASCREDRTRAVAGDLAIGLTITPRFVVGVQTLAWFDVIGGGQDRIVRSTQLTARQFPFANYPVFLAGSVGMASFRLEDDESRFDTRSPSLEAGIGYHWRVGQLLVTPAVHALTSTGGNLTSGKTGNAVTPNARLGLWRTTLGVSWYRALPTASP